MQRGDSIDELEAAYFNGPSDRRDSLSESFRRPYNDDDREHWVIRLTNRLVALIPSFAREPSSPLTQTSPPSSALLSPSVAPIRHIPVNPMPLAGGKRFKENRISNTKYTPLTFLPLNLWEQFGRFMNAYFLLIACLQLFPSLTPVSPVTTWVPLAVIFSISAIKEATDDFRRYKSDRHANERLVRVLRAGEEVTIESQFIRAGEIVRIEDGQEFPCDLVLLASTGEQKSCLVQTANIDGETDLKQRQSCSITAAMTARQLSMLRGHLAVPEPNRHIYSFDATMSCSIAGFASDEQLIGLTAKQLLLQGTFLRNTERIYGLAVYTGQETKLGMNKRMPRTKLTRADRRIDFISRLVFLMQLVLVIVLGVTGNVINTPGRLASAWYLWISNSLTTIWYTVLIIPIRMLLLLSFMIPISLKVSLDLIKLLAAVFISWDREMYDPERDLPAEASNTGIAEDLGMIEWLLTDKTGTLTENIMALKRFCVAGEVFDMASCLETVRNLLATSPKMPSSASPASSASLSSLPTPQQIDRRELPEQLRQFLRCLALCHSVTPVIASDGTAEIFQGPSPDEEALVKAASQLGVRYKGRDPNDMLRLSIASSDRQEERFELLQTLEFSSDRRRMSVVVRSAADGRLWLFVKGADDVVLSRCVADNNTGQRQTVRQKTETIIEEFASQGLRTLCIAGKQLTEQDYSYWSEKLAAANASLENRERKIIECYEAIESRMTLLGVTAIEDRLQPKVPETIASLRRAGIKIWVLTGDKRSTAHQIAISCNLITVGPTAKLIQLELPAAPNHRGASLVAYLLARVREADSFLRGNAAEPLASSAASASHITGSNQKATPPSPNTGTSSSIAAAPNAISSSPLSPPPSPQARQLFLMLDGAMFRRINESPECREIFTGLALRADCIIFCRVTPHQKTAIVELIKRRGYRTLAVGDGGNDVGMIQAAHVGVGIHGREGMQAVRASDYSISQFRYLSRLLLVHGRYAYRRTCMVSLFCFYKSIYLGLGQAIFQLFCLFSGSSFFNTFALSTFNIIFTSLPVLFYALDRDLPARALLQHPEIYRDSLKTSPLSSRQLILWLITAVGQSVITLWITLRATENSSLAEDQITVALLAYSAVVFVVLLTILLHSHTVTVFNQISIWGSLVALIFLLWAAGKIPAIGMLGAVMFQHPAFWLTLFCTVAASMIPLVVYRYWKIWRPPSDGSPLEVERLRWWFRRNRLLQFSDSQAAIELQIGGSFPEYSSSTSSTTFSGGNAFGSQSALFISKGRRGNSHGTISSISGGSCSSNSSSSGSDISDAVYSSAAADSPLIKTISSSAAAAQKRIPRNSY